VEKEWERCGRIVEKKGTIEEQGQRDRSFPKKREEIHYTHIVKHTNRDAVRHVFHESTSVITTTSFTLVFSSCALVKEIVAVKKRLVGEGSGRVRNSSGQGISTA
jgi:hypothetical protein